MDETNIEDMTVEQLKEQPEYERIQGRSSMDKEQLAAAIAAERENPSGGDGGDGGDGGGDGDSDSDGSDDGGDDGEEEVDPSTESGVTEYDGNYVGVAPEYRNAASIGNAPVGDAELYERVRQHDAAMVQPAPGTQSFSEWASKNKGRRNPVTHAEKS